jgi:arylsulfatase A-like enzyme
MLYEEVMRVPLIVKWPADTPGFAARIDAPVSTTQIAATLIDLLGIDSSEAVFQGRSLAAAPFGSTVEPEVPLFFSSRGRAKPNARARPMAAMRIGDMKIHRYEHEDLVELFDLAVDPGERNDLSARDPVRTRYWLQQLRLRQAHSRRLRSIAGSPAEITELDAETRRELRALGYIQ